MIGNQDTSHKGQVVREELNAFEYTELHLSESGTTTATFYNFDNTTEVEESITYIKQRLNEIITANPWLTGRLVKAKSQHSSKKAVFLEYNTEPPVSTREQLFEESNSPSLAKLSSNTISEVVANTIAAEGLIIGKGYKQVNNPNGVLAKFAVIKCTSLAKPSLLLVVSISHQIADGACYYKVFQMLSRTSPIVALENSRDPEYGAKCDEASGGILKKFARTNGIQLNIGWNLCQNALLGCEKTVTIRSWILDEGKINEIKEAVRLDKEGKRIPGTAPFVSTNDIIVSSWAAAIRCDYLIMPINFRGRLENIHDNFAGNYMRLAVYDKRGVASPRYVRQSLLKGTPITPAGGALSKPSFIRSVKARLGLVTNWVFPGFACVVDIHPTKETPVALHLPVYRKSSALINLSVVFRPQKDKVAIMMYMRNGVKESAVKEAGVPIGQAF